MTVERNYYCNLCRGSNMIRGVFFDSSGGWKLVDPRRHNGSSVENHICETCLKSAAKEYRAFIAQQGGEG